MPYTEIELDESILDIDSWLPKEAIDEVVNFIIDNEHLDSNKSHKKK